MEAYPLMVRRRIIELYEQNMSTKDIAALFDICRSGTRRVKQHHRERGDVTPRPRNAGRKSMLTAELSQKIREHVAARPDCTRQELKDALTLSVSLQAISKWLKKLGLVLKKSPSTLRSRTGPTSRPPENCGTRT